MAHTITIKSSGHSFVVADDETILDAALKQGVQLAYGCRNGSCGNCSGQVLRGEIAYPEGLPKSLSMTDMPATRAIFCKATACSDLLISASELPPEAAVPVQLLPARVAMLERLADDVMLMKLSLPANKRMQYLAGQYLEFVLKDGRRRAFSIANAPHNDESIELHIRRVPGGEFTGQVFDGMAIKSIVRIAGPMGGFYLRDNNPLPRIFVAGGTGLAPIKAMIEHCLYTESAPQFTVFWGVRSEQDLYLDDVLRAWAAEHPGIRYIPVLSQPAEGSQWQGETGWVHEAVMRHFTDLSAYQLYMAGPPPMIAAARAGFVGQCGLLDDNLFFDSFDYSLETQTAGDAGNAVD